MLLAGMALVLAALLDVLFIPMLNRLIGRQLMLSGFLVNPRELVWAVLVTLFLGVLTGIYPSLYMTSFNPSRVLKGGSRVEGKSIFRSSLVVLQFGLAVAMIVSTLVVLQQLYFMKNTDIGKRSRRNCSVAHTCRGLQPPVSESATIFTNGASR